MWVQAEQPAHTFWDQTPRIFQLVMQAVRKRLKAELDGRTRQAWESGSFAGLASVGKLKDLKHYLGTSGRRQTPQEMLAVMRSFQAKGAKMKITRIKRET